MPLNAVGWTNEEDEKLVQLVEPRAFLYNIKDPSRKNILIRESTWKEIAQSLSKPGKSTPLSRFLFIVENLLFAENDVI